MNLPADFSRAREGVHPVVSSLDEWPTNKWECPPRGLFKLNCDATVRDNEFVGVGFFIRDNHGQVIAAVHTVLWVI